MSSASGADDPRQVALACHGERQSRGSRCEGAIDLLEATDLRPRLGQVSSRDVEIAPAAVEHANALVDLGISKRAFLGGVRESTLCLFESGPATSEGGGAFVAVRFGRLGTLLEELHLEPCGRE